VIYLTVNLDRLIRFLVGKEHHRVAASAPIRVPTAHFVRSLARLPMQTFSLPYKADLQLITPLQTLLKVPLTCRGEDLQDFSVKNHIRSIKQPYQMP